MACRGDVDTEDLEKIVSIARSGENILCGYLKDFDGCLSMAACLMNRKKK